MYEMLFVLYVLVCILIGYTFKNVFDQDDDNNNHPIMNIKDAFILSNQRKIIK